MKFYTYLWLREDGTPYYIGKGSGRRAHERHGHSVHMPPKDRIVIYPADSEADAFETEIALIWYYGRKDLGTGYLYNHTDGGDNPPSQKGVKRSAKHVAALVNSRKGKTISEQPFCFNQSLFIFVFPYGISLSNPGKNFIEVVRGFI